MNHLLHKPSPDLNPRVISLLNHARSLAWGTPLGLIQEMLRKRAEYSSGFELRFSREYDISLFLSYELLKSFVMPL